MAAFKADVLQAVNGPEELPVMTTLAKNVATGRAMACWPAELRLQVVLHIFARSLLLLFLKWSLM
jgi:hypothetical protein